MVSVYFIKYNKSAQYSMYRIKYECAHVYECAVKFLPQR